MFIVTPTKRYWINDLCVRIQIFYEQKIKDLRRQRNEERSVRVSIDLPSGSWHRSVSDD